MQKIVVFYRVTDGCTYSYEVIHAVEYESTTHLFVHIDEWLKKYSETHYKERSNLSTFTVGNTVFEATEFFYNGSYTMPDILLLEDWFKAKLGS